MTDPVALADAFETTFERIRTTRMADMPILNPALSVQMTGLRDWKGGRLGVLVTPWFINVVLVAHGEGAAHPISGTKKLFHLPAGAFEFIASHEDDLGGFWMCSLFSPALEFGDQETAMAVAEASLDALLTDAEDDAGGNLADRLAEDGSGRDDRCEPNGDGKINRRAFLTVGHGRDVTTARKAMRDAT